MSLANNENLAAKAVRDNLGKFTIGRYGFATVASCRRLGMKFPGLTKAASAELISVVYVPTVNKLRKREFSKQPRLQIFWRSSYPSEKDIVANGKEDLEVYHGRLNRALAVRLAEFKAAQAAANTAAAEFLAEAKRVAETLRGVEKMFLIGRRWNACMGFRGREETTLHHSLPVQEALTQLASLAQDSFGCGLTVFACTQNATQRAVGGLDSDREFTADSGDWRFSAMFNGDRLTAKYNWRGEFSKTVLDLL